MASKSLSAQRAPIRLVSEGVYKCTSITGTDFYIEKTTDFSSLRSRVAQPYLWLLRIPADSFSKIFNTKDLARSFAVSYFQRQKQQMIEDQFTTEPIL